MINNYVPQAYPLWATSPDHLGALLVVGWTEQQTEQQTELCTDGTADGCFVPVVVFEGAGSSTTAGPFVVEGPASYSVQRPAPPGSWRGTPRRVPDGSDPLSGQ